ncbi:hypothetical protein AMTRI_Chr10g228690 [Amborella trichopoda]
MRGVGARLYILKPLSWVAFILTSVLALLFRFFQNQSPHQSSLLSLGLQPPLMATSHSRRLGLVLWLHGLGDNGPASVPIKSFFSSIPEFSHTKWLFPSAPSVPVSCNCVSSLSLSICKDNTILYESPKDEEGVVRAVRNVHAMIDKEVSAGALTLASVLLYPKTLGGGTVFSGWVPFNSSILEKISPEAKRAYPDLGHSITAEELSSLGSWIKVHSQSSS